MKLFRFGPRWRSVWIWKKQIKTKQRVDWRAPGFDNLRTIHASCDNESRVASRTQGVQQHISRGGWKHNILWVRIPLLTSHWLVHNTSNSCVFILNVRATCEHLAGYCSYKLHSGNAGLLFSFVQNNKKRT